MSTAQLVFLGQHGPGDWCERENGPVWDGASFSRCFRTRSLLGIPSLVYLCASVLVLAVQLAWPILRGERRRRRVGAEGAAAKSSGVGGTGKGATVISIAENAVIAEEVKKQGGWGVPDDLKPAGCRSSSRRGADEHGSGAAKTGSSHLAWGLRGSVKDLITTVCFASLLATFLLRWLHVRTLPTNRQERAGVSWIVFPVALFAYCLALSSAKLVFAFRYATLLELQIPEGPHTTLESHLMPVILLLPFFAFLEFREVLVPLLSHDSLAGESRWSFGFGASAFAVALVLAGTELLWPRPTEFLPRFSENVGRGKAVDGATAAHETEASDQVSSTPPFEPRRPLLLVAFFAHVHRFLLDHVGKIPTAQSIPALRADDLTASTLLRWRIDCEKWSADKRPSLVWLLVYHFRWLLLGSQLFSWISSFAVLLPPFFLQKILNWIAQNEEGNGDPVHVAMLYAFGLLITRLVMTWAQSGSLFLGRRLCIRARSILITEILAKGLRRQEITLRTNQPADVGLGTGADELDPSMPNGDASHIASGPGGTHKKAVEPTPQARSTAKAKDPDADDPKHAPTGKIVNLVSTDVFRVSEIGAYLQFVFPEGPAQITFASIYLYILLGPAALAGIAVLGLAAPMQGLLNRLWFKVQKKLMAASDKRLALATEVIAQIRLVKWFAWEENFMRKINETRQIELRRIMQRAVVFVVSGVTMMSLPTAVSIITFSVHTKVLKQPLSAETAFTSLSLFAVMRNPLEQLADMIGNCVQCVVSLKRIALFLQEEETEKYTTVTSSTGTDSLVVGFKSATFSYASATDQVDPGSGTFELTDLDVIFPEGELSLVVGKVGSGKTTVLLSLLGEMTRVSGQVFLPSPLSRPVGSNPATLTATTAYCPQQPWLLSDTIRSNVLFGSAMNEARYREALKACALVPDLEVLDDGDLTEVGEKGTVLSGGQKARIALARALYSPARCLLLDDILSAVDSHTAQHIYAQVLKGPLMTGRTCVLVTHAVELCSPGSALVVYLDKGRISSMARGSPATAITSSNAGENSGQGDATVQKLADGGATAALKMIEHERKKDRKRLIEEERKEEGAVSFAVYKLYIDAFGGWTIFLLAILLFILAQASEIALNWTLRSWAGSYERGPESAKAILFAFSDSPTFGERRPPQTRLHIASSERPPEASTDYYIRLYLTLGVGSMVLYLARMLFFMWRGVVAGRVLYTRLINSLFGARMRFFDSTPQGRIMNRLSKDQQTIDQDLALGLMFFAMELLGGLSVVLIIVAVVPAFLIAAVFIAAMFAGIGYLYLATAREVKRLESVTRSPIYALCSECLNGVTSIRAYGDTTRFMRSVFSMIDANNQPFLTIWFCNRWLSVHIDIASALIAFSAAAFVINKPDMSASLAGFVLAYASTFSEKMLWIVRLWSFNELNLNSVERFAEYITGVEQETKGGVHPPAAWPSRHASIEVEKLTAAYAPHLPPALREVSFVVEPGSKIGICGRTGSGKSTLASTFFRVIEAQSGRIVIDGLDISKLDLHDLRSRLAIIPQEAVLFKGSVRWNLDPFSEYEDSQLWEALRRVGMASETPWVTPGPSRRASSTNLVLRAEDDTVIRSLSTEVQEGGKNFSTGQRQLLAIARAILKLQQTSILILDESTASLDSDSDQRIQDTIRAEMGQNTILCIAHRLATIIDYDKILCLGEGRVLEFDTPWDLLERDDSHFAALCRRSGHFDQLKQLALRAKAAKAQGTAA